MIKQRKIELLAPAKNLECGIEAINHGADAVYIGAPKFGARAAAVNSLEDIETLVRHAHLYNARVYITINTILKEDELKETEEMIHALYQMGVDALIVQDMGITQLNLPPIPLHASTQMDNRTPEKVKFLQEAGFRQVVLARELSLYEIKKIHDTCPETPLEVFVHGALCVSYSGQCYVSQACFGRSANRGECAQFCRLPFSLVDAEEKVIVRDKHLLSLKDLNQSDELEQLLDAGVSSFKIEGRLKDVSYVKNVTAAYRQKLDAILARRQEYVRSSSGTCRYEFQPQLDKSFSRGFTHYFLHGRDKEVSSFDTPKSLGEEMGTMKEVRGNYLTVAGLKSFNNGDGVCYIDEQGRLQGFRINRVDGNKLYPQEMPHIKPRTKLYRNFDQEFERVLSRKSAERKIAVNILLADHEFGFSLTLTDEDDNSITLTLPHEKESARTPQTENLKAQLSKLGNTPFEAQKIEISLAENWFLPASVLADFRRRAVDQLIVARRINYPQELAVWKPTTHTYPQHTLTYLGNVMNPSAASFYQEHGVQQMAAAYEKERVENAVLMFCKHCLRYSMGWCPIHQRVRSPYKEPYYLVSTDGKRFRLEFDCKNCQMKIRAVISLLFCLFFLSSCYYARPNLSSEEIPQETKDSLNYLYERHYTLDTNLELEDDSISLECLPIKDTYITLHRGDRVVVAEFAVHPADSVDSIWVKLAHTQDKQGWIREVELKQSFAPTDSISQAIHFFSDTHTSYFMIIFALFVGAYLFRAFRRKQLQMVYFNDIDSVYPLFLCLLMAFSATIYESMQVFTPDTWEHFYFNPTLSPFKVPFILAVFLLSIWLFLIVALVVLESLFRQLTPAAAIFYLLGLLSCCIFCYFFFILMTHIYIGYIFLAFFIWVFTRKVRKNIRYKYRCGQCGEKLKEKGVCPHCGAINV